MLPPSQLARLEGFHVECARRITGMRPREVKGKWVYPKSSEVLAKAGLQTVGFYIQQRRHNIARTISGRKVLQECKGAEKMTGSSSKLCWWEQDLSAPMRADVKASCGAYMGRGRGGGGATGRTNHCRGFDGDGVMRRAYQRQQAEEGIILGGGPPAPAAPAAETRPPPLPLARRGGIDGRP